jgi:hypothetical protein
MWQSELNSVSSRYHSVQILFCHLLPLSLNLQDELHKPVTPLVVLYGLETRSIPVMGEQTEVV